MGEFSAATAAGGTQWVEREGWGGDPRTDPTAPDVAQWFGVTCAKRAAKGTRTKGREAPKKRGPVRRVYLDRNGLQVGGL